MFNSTQLNFIVTYLQLNSCKPRSELILNSEKGYEKVEISCIFTATDKGRLQIRATHCFYK